MAYTIPVSFDTFASNIEVSGYNREVAKGRENKVKSLLEDRFEILDIFSIGSLPKYTAVKNHADLDIFVVLHYSKHIKDREPSAVLLSVKNVLKDYAVSVRRNGQAVSLSFKTWPDVDIVPVYRNVNSDKTVNYYSVPNMHTERWIKSQPRLHASKMSKKNNSDACGSKFKRVVKMAKWWNYENGGYLSSYHIETMALDTLFNEITDYNWTIYYLFKQIQEKVHKNIHDGIAHISSDLTSAQKEAFDQRLSNAVRRLGEARDYITNGNNEKAIEKYRVVFGTNFPSYG